MNYNLVGKGIPVLMGHNCESCQEAGHGTGEIDGGRVGTTGGCALLIQKEEEKEKEEMSL